METKLVTFVIAPRDFRDEELLETKKVVEAAGFRTEVASQTLDVSTGKLGAQVQPDKTVQQINPNETDALVFVGGKGCAVYYQDAQVLGLAKQAHNAGKVVAAICAAPEILANAGLLAGTHATCDDSIKDSMKRKGIVCTPKEVEVEDRVITGHNAAASKSFGQAIVDRLSQ